MKNFLTKMADFMHGRYGNDKLNNFILLLAAVLYFINFFVRNTILMIIVIVLVILVIARAMSTNITKRLYENRRFVAIYTALGTFLRRQYLRVRDFRTHRYVVCPYCRAQLRLKKRTGTQHIRCPKCRREFTKNIRF